MMKIWLLKKTERAQDEYEYLYQGFVIRAPTEESARRIAAEAATHDFHQGAWLNPEWATCEEVTAEGEVGVILDDYRT